MVLPTPYTTPYTPPYDQYQNYQQQPQYNTFAKQGETNKTMPNNVTESILDQITKLLASRKPANHQLHEIQAAMPTAGNIWDMTNVPEPPAPQDDDSQE